MFPLIVIGIYIYIIIIYIYIIIIYIIIICIYIFYTRDYGRPFQCLHALHRPQPPGRPPCPPQPPRRHPRPRPRYAHNVRCNPCRSAHLVLVFTSTSAAPSETRPCSSSVAVNVLRHTRVLPVSPHQSNEYVELPRASGFNEVECSLY